jgi:hypothetical protein
MRVLQSIGVEKRSVRKGGLVFLPLRLLPTVLRIGGQGEPAEANRSRAPC